MPRSNKTNKPEYNKTMSLDEAGSILDKYTDAEPIPTTKKVEKVKKAIKRHSFNKEANRQLGVLEDEGY